MLVDAVILAGDAADKARIPRVGRVVGRLGAKDIRIEFQFERRAVDAQILEMRAEKRD